MAGPPYRCARCGRNSWSRSQLVQDPRNGQIYCKDCGPDALKTPAPPKGNVAARPVAIELDAQDAAVLQVLAEDGESPADTLRRVVKSIGRDYVTRLAPAQFERLVGRAFEAYGYRIRQTGGPGDQGIDVLATKDGRTIAVQCKRYDAAQFITPREIRELLGAATAAKATEALFVTTSTFTTAAREFARSQNIWLIDIDALPNWLAQPTEIFAGGAGARDLAP